MQSHTVTTQVPSWIEDDRHSRRLWRKLSCVLFGHKVNNAVFITMRGREKQCRCGAHYLSTWMETRVSHTVSCFLRGHRYEQIAVRSGHNEYVCVQCGHPLLFRTECCGSYWCHQAV